jgi:hypothetical protein
VCLNQIDGLIFHRVPITMAAWCGQARHIPDSLSRDRFSTYSTMMSDLASLLENKEVANIVQELLYNGGKWRL